MISSIRGSRFLALVAMVTALLVLPHAAKAATTQDASSYIESLGNHALGIIADKALDKNQKQAGLEKLFSDNVDFNWVSRFVMGQYWRKASDEQKSRYLPAYQRFLILHYTSRFTDYTSGSFKVTSSRNDGDNEYTVSMQIKSSDAGSEPVLVDYRVRDENGTGFKIFDVIVEGVSLITTQRSEFASVINSKGIDYLIDQLATKQPNT